MFGRRKPTVVVRSVTEVPGLFGDKKGGESKPNPLATSVGYVAMASVFRKIGPSEPQRPLSPLIIGDASNGVIWGRKGEENLHKSIAKVVLEPLISSVRGLKRNLKDLGPQRHTTTFISDSLKEIDVAGKLNMKTIYVDREENEPGRSDNLRRLSRAVFGLFRKPRNP